MPRLRLLLLAMVGVLLLAATALIPFYFVPLKERFEQGRRALDQKDYDRAIACFDEVLRGDPKHGEAFFYRGCAWFEKKDHERAIADLTEALSTNSRTDDVYYQRALAYIGQGKYELALSDLNAAIRLRPLPVYHVSRADVHNLLKDFDAAAADCDAAIRLVPHYSEAYDARGYAFKKKGHFDKAVADYLHAVELNPENSMARVRLAWLLATCPEAGVRDGKKALEHARMACELTSWEDPACLHVLAAAYAEVGFFAQAVDWQQKALDLPRDPRESQEDLEKERAALRSYKEGKPQRDE